MRATDPRPQSGALVLLRTLEEIPKWYTLLGVAIYVVLVAVVDYVTTDRYPLMVLYLPAVFVTCWVIGLSKAVMLALFCSTIWLFDNWSLPWVPQATLGQYWLTTIHLCFFTVISSVVARLRLSLVREEHFAQIDFLTGLANNQSFVHSVEVEMARSRRSGLPMTLAFVDCDNFKAVNDSLGHLTGDELLRVAADTMRDSLRPSDVVARLGGDEFALLLPETSADDAQTVVDRMHERLGDVMHQRHWPVTVSIGVVTYHVPPDSVEEMIRAADQLMYVVKHSTKDGVRYKLVG